MKTKRKYEHPLMQVIQLRETSRLLQMSSRKQYKAEDTNPFDNQSAP